MTCWNARESETGRWLRRLLRPAGIALAVACFSPDAHARMEVVGCDASAMEDLNWVINFSETHLSAVLELADFIPSKHKDKLREMLVKGKLKCTSKGKCNDRSSVGGYQHGLGADIDLCWDNLRSKSQTRCALVRIVFHEKAHAAGVPIEAKHNADRSKGYGYVNDIDLVYRFGYAAEDYCAQIASAGDAADWSAGNDPIESTNSGKLALGAFCSRDTQCSSNKCEKGTCTCKTDGDDCAGNMRCVNRLGKNFCVPPAASLGSYCQKDKDCGVGTCNGNVCVCDGDKQCDGLPAIGSNPRCAKPLGKKNFCQSTNVVVGNYCQKDSDCKSGRCKGDFCKAK